MCATLRAERIFSSNFFLLKAFPPAKYFWQFENGTQTRNGAARGFVGSVQRAEGGRYTCTAFNELGNIKAEGGLTFYLIYDIYLSSFAAHLNVLFKPECTINKKVQDQVLYLSCQVEAFPPNVTYFWYHNEKLISCEYNSDIEYKLDSLSLCTFMAFNSSIEYFP